MLKQRQLEIKEKGFNFVRDGVIYDNRPDLDFWDETRDFSKIKVGLRTVDDATFKLGTYRKVNPKYGDKQYILNAIYRHDYNELREISEYFYESSGIYYRLCRYLAFLYRYDWYVTPFVTNTSAKGKEASEPKLLGDFAKVLNYLDKSQVKKLCGDIALEIIKGGAFYGYIMDFGDSFGIQKLPATYCRTRFYCGSTPCVELNLRFFDVYFPQM